MSYGNGGSFDPGSVPGGQRPYPQSYNDPNTPYRQPPRSSNRTLFWVLGIIALLGVLGVVACCGFGYYGFRFISTQFANQLRPQLQNSPEIVEHIGEIQEMALNPQAMQQPDHSGKMVFDVSGTKGTGQVVVDPEKFGDRGIDEDLILILPDGKRIPLTGLGPLPEPVDPDAADSESETAQPTDEAQPDAPVPAESEPAV